jgi:two-component system nitrogen regulation response regulator NtrX
MSIEILIVDDNSDIRSIINDLIIDAGYRTRLAANYNQALKEIDKKLPDVAIIDVKLDKGDNDGLELLSHIKTKDKNIPVIIITGHANVEMAIKALKAGAFEFIEKPFNQERLLNFINRAIENLNLKIKNKEFEDKLFYSYDLIGNSPNVQNIKNQIEKISILETRIFIHGPTGSGKELIARKIHKESKRQKGPFIVLNGALLDIKKYESELFGEEKNNGSISYGALEKATGGILLIDEISEIPLETQSKILRVLIDQKFKRINGDHDIKVNVRIICSTSKDIKKEVDLGNFREDLYHRLNVFEINIDANNSYLLNYDWPGNIRELRNLIERIAILSPDTKEKISNIIKESLKTPENIDSPVESSLSVPLKEARENFEKEYLTIQLRKFNGNISKTAAFIGMERSALHRKLKGLGIKELN